MGQIGNKFPGTSREVVASAARTATGNSGALESKWTSVINLLVDVTATAGTGETLDISIEWSHDGSTWFAADTADAFTQITAATSVVKRFDTKGPQYRVVWTIAGTTPSFTFSIIEYDDKE